MALNSLPLFHRVSGQRVVVLGDGDAADAPAEPPAGTPPAEGPARAEGPA